jgi:hypothetical protein
LGDGCGVGVSVGLGPGVTFGLGRGVGVDPGFTMSETLIVTGDPPDKGVIVAVAEYEPGLRLLISTANLI